MAKMNSPFRAKVASNANLRKSGQTSGGTHWRTEGKFITHYVQGHHAFRDGMDLNPRWHPHKQQGWKKARDEALALFVKTHGKVGLAVISRHPELYQVLVG